MAMTSPSSGTDFPDPEAALPPQVFNISPLIRVTLLGFYVALTLPLPFLAAVTAAPVPPWGLALVCLLGAGALLGALGQRVVVDDTGIAVTYPQALRWLLRGSWRLNWADIRALKPRSTGQGGLVYYFVDTAATRAYLLPMRVAGFAHLVALVEARTGIDTQDVRPLSQPWMYGILLTLTLMLLAIDVWTIGTAVQIGAPLATALL